MMHRCQSKSKQNNVIAVIIDVGDTCGKSSNFETLFANEYVC